MIIDVAQIEINIDLFISIFSNLLIGAAIANNTKQLKKNCEYSINLIFYNKVVI
jgi:hypothetical protein